MTLINFPTAKPAIITKVNVTAAHEVGERNIGSKLIHYETPTGTIETVEGFEPAFKANIVFGADWITYDPDGKHARIDLASIATTEDGGSIDYRYTGVITITEDVAKIFAMAPDAKTVPFGFSRTIHSFQSAKFPELENTRFIGNGRMIINDDHSITVESRVCQLVPATGMD